MSGEEWGVNKYKRCSKMFLANFNFEIMNGAGRRSRTRDQRGNGAKLLDKWPLVVEYQLNINYQPTQWQLLPRVRGQCEAKHRHRGDQEARDDEVVEVVHRPPPDLDGEGDVKIRLRATLINHLVPFCRNTWEMFRNIIIIGHGW